MCLICMRFFKTLWRKSQYLKHRLDVIDRVLCSLLVAMQKGKVGKVVALHPPTSRSEYLNPILKRDGGKF